MSFSLAIDPATGDLVRDADGQIATTTDPSPELLLAISVPVGSFHGDPEQGSRIPDILRGPPPSDLEAEVEAAARDGLRRLEEVGLVAVESIDFSAHTRELSVWTDELADPFTAPLENADG
ncbi:hypothetical protein [Haliangium sp.]|uniref:hypothetical protein n=1 Tax=Haliangium sp. TaxID=2663208 RepID=UPI003D0E5059